jgi:HEAT repeat protein
LAQPGNAASSANQPAMPRVPCPDLPPELVRHPKYLILRELGRGGMGVVYQARQTVMNRPVVIKVINRSLLDQPGALDRFRREVQAAAKLSHPNIVTAYDAEQAGEVHMLVMEFVPGQSLAEVLEKRGPLPVLNACHCMRQVALGLQHAHERNMVHRDIKPSNLMLMPRGQVKILDFGLAKIASERGTGKGLTPSNDFLGTPEYCAPEQTTDARTADIRADLYSLGCTLYCLLAGRPPFQEDTPMKTFLAHHQNHPQPLPELRPDVPARLWEVVARLLAKEPGQRYQTPIEVAQALAPFVKPSAKPGAKDDPAPALAVDATSKGWCDASPNVRMPMLYFACPYCGKDVKAPAGAAGKACRCPKCRRLFEVPVAFQGGAPPVRSAPPGLAGRVIIDVEPEPKTGLPVPIRPVPRELPAQLPADGHYGPPALVAPEWESPARPNKTGMLAVSLAIIAGLLLFILLMVVLWIRGQKEPFASQKASPPPKTFPEEEPKHTRETGFQTRPGTGPNNVPQHVPHEDPNKKPKPGPQDVGPQPPHPKGDSISNLEKQLESKEHGDKPAANDNQEELKRQNKKKLDGYIKTLKGGREADRIKAAQEIGKMGEEAKDALEALCDALVDANKDVGAAVLAALEKVDPRLGPLVRILRVDKDPAHLLQALKSLAKLEEEGKPAYSLLLKLGTGNAKRQFGPLGTIGDLKQTGEEMIRTLAAIAPKEKKVLQVLTDCLLFSRAESARVAAAEGLGRTSFRTEAAAVLMKSLLKDPADNVRAAAANALGELGQDAKKAVPALESATTDPSAKVREAADMALQRIKGNE